MTSILFRRDNKCQLIEIYAIPTTTALQIVIIQA
ncbi:hypothetical protein DR85_745 [Francisella tularensis]|nr:hypothetical protein DR85_745 [Francisella tularensis]